MESSLLDLVRAVAVEGSLAGVAAPRWRRGSAVTTIVAAAGYPDAARTGDVVGPPPAADDLFVFHAGTRRREDGALVSAGGRVLAVTAVAPSLADARDRSRAAAQQVELAGKQLRADIAWRELARQGAGHAGAA
jgi:phosphoribosylamine--glycine ligase